MGSDDCAIVAYCTNTVGGFSCACHTGHEGDGETYSDIDECVVGTVDHGRFLLFRSFWIFRARKVQNFPARLVSSELSAHQMSPSGTPH